MKRSAEKCNVTFDRLTTGKAADGLVDNCLENGGGKVVRGGAFIDQRLDVRLGKYTAAGCDGIS